MRYPVRDRYTLQWLKTPGRAFANNIDAAFKANSRKAKPCNLLLHYNYGAAAVKQWGHGVKFFNKKAMHPRPAERAPPSIGSSKSHDRTIAIRKHGKLTRTRGVRKAKGKSTTGARKRKSAAGAGDIVELEGRESWDEDDVMLFFWGNTPAAKERHRRKDQESSQRMETWREGVPHGLA